MRIGIVGLLQESNTFIEAETTLLDFDADLLLSGAAIRTRLENAPHEVGGFFEAIDRAGFEAVPLLVARALPHGPLSDSCYESLCQQLDQAYEQGDHLDGVLVACHGANVATATLDVDGDWLGRIRHRVGDGVPVVATLDLHANLSRAMVAATDAIVGYRTNPHLDQRARGIEAGDLLSRALRGEIRLTQAARFPRLVINIERQSTAESPCREIFAKLEEQRRSKAVLSNSFLLGFPYADVPDLGAAIVVVTDGDQELAESLADELEEEIWSRRAEFQGRGISIAKAMTTVEGSTDRVCLLDMGDNVGGGSPGDGTLLARELYECEVPRSFVCLFDPRAVSRAEALGEGGRAQFSVGGASWELHGGPLRAEWTVVSHRVDGTFREAKPRHGGFTTFDQGPNAVLRSERGLTVLVTSKRMVPFSLVQLTSCGLDPTDFDVLVAKGVHAPVAAYREVCETLLRVDTPGVTSADLSRFEYRHRRRPLYPFEEMRETRWS